MGQPDNLSAHRSVIQYIPRIMHMISALRGLSPLDFTHTLRGYFIGTNHAIAHANEECEIKCV